MQYFVCLAHRAQHIQAGSAANVGSETDAYTLVPCATQVEKAAAKKEVRGRAKRDGTAAIRHALPVLIVEMQAVCKYRPLPNQSKMIVYIEVTATPRKLLCNKINFLVVLSKMRMNMYVRKFCCQFADHFQLCFA